MLPLAHNEGYGNGHNRTLHIREVQSGEAGEAVTPMTFVQKKPLLFDG